MRKLVKRLLRVLKITAYVVGGIVSSVSFIFGAVFREDFRAFTSREVDSIFLVAFLGMFTLPAVLILFGGKKKIQDSEDVKC